MDRALICGRRLGVDDGYGKGRRYYWLDDATREILFDNR